MQKIVDLTGKQFGLLTVNSRDFRKRARSWNCSCRCGKLVVVRDDYLQSTPDPSCGCIKRNLLFHGLSSKAEYKIWSGMKARCTNPKNAVYYKYGARGIGFCERWKSFRNFYHDMGDRPSAKHTLDRIDGAKDYGPDNCRWATPKEQQRNLKNNVILHHDGKAMIAADWASEVGINAKTIQSRIAILGWTTEDALTLPLHSHHKR